jgi:hypothetical protein
VWLITFTTGPFGSQLEPDVGSVVAGLSGPEGSRSGLIRHILKICAAIAS